MNVLQYFRSITTFIFDLDGVLTDGTVLVLENGLQARRMHVKDGLALQMALKANYNVVIVSGGYSPPVIERLQKLGVKEIFFEVGDKAKFIEDYLRKNRIRWDEVLFMGDDLPDIAVLEKVEAPCCPADAVMEVKKVSKYISSVNGGYGCVRDVIEKVLKLNDQWEFDTDVTSR
jgi:3-deoxy-D-manno-octulosonate 8-phosphate phosphatase (KDO 8-P phosphatase)